MINSTDSGERQSRKAKWKFGLFLITLIVGYNQPLLAQLIPDTTLGSEKSTVSPVNELNDRIDGGARRGRNLFHSFLDFNVGKGKEVYFTNPAGIENIFTRVTGSNLSQIFGKLGVLGEANLLLLNPNGIVFGSNASLDIRGSFLATTANGIHFGNEGFFSATEPDSSRLLSVNPSALFFNQIAQQSGSIVNNANLAVGKDLTFVAANLILEGQLIAGNNLILQGNSFSPTGIVLHAGGNVFLDTYIGRSLEIDATGSLTINGNIDVSSKTGNGGDVSLLAGGDIIFVPGTSVTSTGLLGGNITLKSQGTISLDGGSITSNSNSSVSNIQSGNIKITAQSFELDNAAELLTTTSSKANAGDLWIQVADQITVDGESVLGSSVEVDEKDSEIAHTLGKSGNIYIEAGSLILNGLSDVDSIRSGLGNSGNINIKANDLISLSGGSSIRSDIFGQGNTGSITIDAPNAVISLDGRQMVEDEEGNFVQPSSISTFMDENDFSQGQTGDVQINAKSIELTNGAAIITAINGIGDTGDINLKVVDTLKISGGSRVQSFILGQGNAGDITIDAPLAVVNLDGIATLNDGENPIQLIDIFSGILTIVSNPNSSSQMRDGDAGDVNITAKTLSVTNGAQIFTVNLAQGNSGSITVKVDDSLLLNGGSALRTDIVGQGTAGTIEINAPNASVWFDGVANIPIFLTPGFEQAFSSPSGVSSNIRLFSSFVGEGKAEDIQITALSLTLANGAEIAATTISGSGGNITLNLSDRLLLRHQSLISTSAGETGKPGNGGNITINSPFIIAVPQENSDIRANAFEGEGGNVNINTQGIFGIQFRSQDTPLSDITVTSQFGLEGTVNITNPNANLTNRLFELPENTVDAERLVTQNICSVTKNQIARGSSLTVTGRGGIPPNPSDPLTQQGTVDWATRSPQEKKPSVILRERSQNHQPTIQPIQGWVIAADGTIILTANTPRITPQSPFFNPPSCHSN